MPLRDGGAFCLLFGGAVHVSAECLVDEVVFAPGAVEEAPEEGGGEPEKIYGEASCSWGVVRHFC